MGTRIGTLVRLSFALIVHPGFGDMAFAQEVVPEWKIDQVFQFDGIGDHVRITHRSQFRVQSFTLAAWIYTEDTSLHQPIIAKALAKGNWTSYMLRLQENGRVALAVENEKEHASAHWLSHKAVMAKQWHHLAATRKNRQGDVRDAVIYLDGEPLELAMIRNVSYGPAFRLGFSGEPLFIGRDEHPSGHFKGSIKGVTIIGRALDPREIEKLATFREPAKGTK
jgi:hypothetical protein